MKMNLHLHFAGDDSFILDLLKDTIHILTYSPGDFDGLIDSFAETLSMFITKRETMEELVSIFVNKVRQGLIKRSEIQL